jgi:hypothetical protein
MQFDEARAAVISDGLTAIVRDAGRFRKGMTLGGHTCGVWQRRWKANGASFGFDVHMIAFVIRRGRRTVAAGEIQVFRPGGFVDFDDFIFCCDEESVEANGIAELLRKHWSRSDRDRLVAWGDVVWFKRLFVESSGGRVPWPAMVESILGNIGLEAALMVLEAVPLVFNKTYGGYGAQRRWSAALMRLYARDLGVQCFAGEAGKRGWMWRVWGDAPAPRSALRAKARAV